MRAFLGRVLLWWLVGYLVVSAVNGVLTLGLGLLLEGTHGAAAYDIAYEHTVVAHMLVGLVVWCWAAARVLRRLAPGLITAIRVAGVWLTASVLVDAVVFVGLLSHTPAGAPADVFYVENQPWTSLYYVAVVAGPLVVGAWTGRANACGRRPGPRRWPDGPSGGGGA